MGDITSLRCVSVISSISTAYGGPAIGSVMLNSALNQMGVAATLLTAGYPVGSTLDSAEIAWINTITTKKVRYLSPSRSHFMQSSWEMLAELRELAGHVDWIHIHCRYRMPELYAYTVATKAGVPYGLQPHGVLEPYQRRTSRWKKSAYDTIIGRKVIENASYVLFGSQEEADNASDLVRPEQALVAPLGAHLDPPLRPATMDEVEQGNRMGNVLFLGRLARKKRADTLVDAWAGITADDAQLIIAGPDGDFRGAELVARGQRLGATRPILAVGRVDGGEKAWLYQQCGIFVLPSENENFGITVAEAMLAGCHVITTKQVAAGEHLLKAGAGTVLDAADPDTLRHAIEVALSDPDLVAESGRRANAYATANLLWNSTAEAIARRVAALRGT